MPIEFTCGVYMYMYVYSIDTTKYANLVCHWMDSRMVRNQTNNNKISTIRTSENEDNTFSMYSNMTCQVPYSERSINSSTDAIDRREGATFFTVSHASFSPSFSCCEYILLCHTFDIERNLVTWENTQHRQLAVRFHLSDISLGTIIYGSLS